MYLIGIDLGTTGCKSMVFDEAGTILGEHYIEYDVIFLPGGGAEQDANIWWDHTVTAVRGAIAQAGIDGSEVGVDDLVESVVLHDVSFRLAWRRSCFLFFPLAAAVSLVCFSVISARVALPFPRVWGAAPVFSPAPAASCLFVLLCLHYRQTQPSMSCNDR